MDQMNKKALIMGVSALAVAGLVTGCICMKKQMKKNKFNIDCLSSNFCD